MASGVYLKFSKSCIFGVNVGGLEFTESFFRCKEMMLLFRYLGLPVDVNLKNGGSWEPLLKLVTEM